MSAAAMQRVLDDTDEASIYSVLLLHQLAGCNTHLVPAATAASNWTLLLVRSSKRSLMAVAGR